MKEVSDFLQKCDLGTGQIGIKESFEFRSEKDMTTDFIKEKFNQVCEEIEYTLIHIEGGKVE